MDLEKISEKVLTAPAFGEHVLALVEEAYRIFERAGIPQDFCLQHVGLTNLVFGSTNRLLWSVQTGFVPDKSSCTEKFLNNWTKEKLID